MARVTVEDCLENIDNRFELVLLATRRARQLANGAESTVPWENDKATVVALREIAEDRISHKILDDREEAEQLAAEAEQAAIEEERNSI